MQKSIRLRAIFAELRAAGVDAPARDLIRIANYILLTFSADAVDDDLESRPVDPRSLLALPIDQAMNDGGWRVLEFETRRQVEQDEPSPEARSLFLHCIRKVLGAEWQFQRHQD